MVKNIDDHSHKNSANKPMMLTWQIPLQQSGEIKHAHRNMVEKSLKITHFSQKSHLSKKNIKGIWKRFFEGRTHPSMLKDAFFPLVYIMNM
jgi:hypothetical protein